MADQATLVIKLEGGDAAPGGSGPPPPPPGYGPPTYPGVKKNPDGTFQLDDAQPPLKPPPPAPKIPPPPPDDPGTQFVGGPPQPPPTYPGVKRNDDGTFQLEEDKPLKPGGDRPNVPIPPPPPDDPGDQFVGGKPPAPPAPPAPPPPPPPDPYAWTPTTGPEPPPAPFQSPDVAAKRAQAKLEAEVKAAIDADKKEQELAQKRHQERMRIDDEYRQKRLDAALAEEEFRRKEQEKTEKKRQQEQRTNIGIGGAALGAAGFTDVAAVMGGFAAGNIAGAVTAAVAAIGQKVGRVVEGVIAGGSFSGDERRRAEVSILQEIPIIGKIADLMNKQYEMAMKNVEMAGRAIQNIATQDAMGLHRAFGELIGGIEGKLIGVFTGLSDAVLATARRVSAYDGALAMGIARLEIRRMERDMELARDRGPDLLRAVERRMEFEDRWGEFMNRMMPVLTSLMDRGMSFLERNAARIERALEFLFRYLESRLGGASAGGSGGLVDGLRMVYMGVMDPLAVALSGIESSTRELADRSRGRIDSGDGSIEELLGLTRSVRAAFGGPLGPVAPRSPAPAPGVF